MNACWILQMLFLPQYLFLVNSSFYYYVISFVSSNFLCSEVYFNINMVTPAFLKKIIFALFSFFHPFTFHLPMWLYLKWVSYRQYMILLILYLLRKSLLIGVFKLFKFKVIIDMLGLKFAILSYLYGHTYVNTEYCFNPKP